MSTKFYLSSSATGNLTPNYSSFWTKITSADRRIASTGKSFSPLTEKVYPRFGDFSGNKFVLIRQYISPPITKAQTLSGTVNGQLMTRETITGNGVFGALAINLVNNTGAIIGNIFSGISTTEYAASNTNRYTPITGNINPTVLLSGNTYYLTFEYGAYTSNLFVTTNMVYNTFGDNAGNDLLIDQSFTSTGNPWLNFSKTIQF